MFDLKQKSVVGCSDLSHLYAYNIHLLLCVFIKTIKRSAPWNLHTALLGEKEEPTPLKVNNLLVIQTSTKEILAYGVSKKQHILACKVT